MLWKSRSKLRSRRAGRDRRTRRSKTGQLQTFSLAAQITYDRPFAGRDQFPAGRRSMAETYRAHLPRLLCANHERLQQECACNVRCLRINDKPRASRSPRDCGKPTCSACDGLMSISTGAPHGFMPMKPKAAMRSASH